MPLFEFQCEDCKERFEELLRKADHTEELSCPACGSTQVRRLQSGFATVSGSTGAGSTSSTSCTPRGGFS